MSNLIVQKIGHYQHQNGTSSHLATVNDKCKAVCQEGRGSAVQLLQNAVGQEGRESAAQLLQKGGLECGRVPEFFDLASELAACEFCNKRVLIRILEVHSKQCPRNPESEPKLLHNATKKNRKQGVRANGQTKNIIKNPIHSYQFKATKRETDTLRGGAAVKPNNNVTREANWINETERRKGLKLGNGGTVKPNCETELKRKIGKEAEIENGTVKSHCESESEKKIRKGPEIENDTVKSGCETESKGKIRKELVVENGTVKSNYETESKRRKIDSQPKLENGTVKSDCGTVSNRSLCQISKEPAVGNDEGKSAIKESNKVTKIDIPFDIPKRHPLKNEYTKAQKQELKVHRDERSPNLPDLKEFLNKGVNILSGSEFSPTPKSSHSWDKPPIKESQTKSVPSFTLSKKDPFVSIKAALRNRNDAEKLGSGLQTSGPGPPLFKRNNNKNESFKNSFIQEPIHSKAIQNLKNPLSYLIPSQNALRQEPSSIINNSPIPHNALKYTFVELPKSRLSPEKISEKTGEENTGESSSNSERPPR